MRQYKELQKPDDRGNVRKFYEKIWRPPQGFIIEAY